MNEELKPMLDNIVYVNSYGLTYNFSFDFSINKAPSILSWDVVDAAAFEKENTGDTEE